MRKFLLLVLSLIFVPSVYASVEVKMTQNGFVPDTLEINQGEEINFVNIDSNPHWPASDIHPTHLIYPEFDPKKPINPGESWRFEFNKAGVWKFHDHLDPQNIGTITADGQNVPRKDILSLKQLLDEVFSFLGKAIGNINFPQKLSNNFNCSNSDFNCVGKYLRRVTIDYGPKAALKMLAQLQNTGKILKSVDDHQLAHQIGRQTAETFGIDAKAFLLCPMEDFNGGCQHGFFEYALSKINSPREAAESICSKLGSSFSRKDQFYCYHGVGHGILMAEAYDLKSSLDICDSLDSHLGQDGCWQGVFMENVNAGMSGKARPGIFSETDPLTPCDQVAQRYKQECYINHSGYLMDFFGNDIVSAANSCLKAEGSYKNSCIQSLGLMVSNPTWQQNISISGNSQSIPEKAWLVCSRFPSEFVEQCLIGAVDNLMNFNPNNLAPAQDLCNFSSDQYRRICFLRIGLNVRNNSVGKNIIKNKCGTLKNQEVNLCLEGARND